MPIAVRLLCISLPLLMAADSAVAGVAVGDEVVLRLTDGRLARGTLAADGSDGSVVIESSAAGIRLASRFATERVVEIVAAAEHDANDDVPRIMIAGPPRPPVAPVPSVVLSTAAIRPPIATAARVRSLFVEADIANWDSDPAPDGLLVRVVPRTEFGRVVPVAGRIDLELFVQQFDTNRRLPWRRRTRGFFTPDRWSEGLAIEDFGPYGVYVKLPFRTLNPEFDLDVAPWALLNAKLAVPGAGVFTASDANVRLRPLSRFRDELEQFRGRRYLPDEHARRRPSSPSSRWRTDR